MNLFEIKDRRNGNQIFINLNHVSTIMPYEDNAGVFRVGLTSGHVVEVNAAERDRLLAELGVVASA